MKVIFNNSSLVFKGYKESIKLLEVYSRISSYLTNASSNVTAVKRLLYDLEIDNPTGIWSRIKVLYLPVLAKTTDSDKAFYEVISNKVIAESNATVVEKRGVYPMRVNEGFASHTVSGLDIADVSMFGVTTQRTDTTLQNSSAGVCSVNGYAIYWENTGTSLYKSNTHYIMVNGSTNFALVPQTFCLSSESGGERTLCTREGAESGSVPFGSGSTSYRLADRSYAAISVFGLGVGITVEDAAKINAALIQFADSFGIESEN